NWRSRPRVFDRRLNFCWSANHKGGSTARALKQGIGQQRGIIAYSLRLTCTSWNDLNNGRHISRKRRMLICTERKTGNFIKKKHQMRRSNSVRSDNEPFVRMNMTFGEPASSASLASAFSKPFSSILRAIYPSGSRRRQTSASELPLWGPPISISKFGKH